MESSTRRLSMNQNDNPKKEETCEEKEDDYKKLVRFLKDQETFHEPEYLGEVRKRLHLKTVPEQVILVAGTNGKGTTSATIAALLQASGKHVGFFSSPHLISTTERIKYDNEDISQKDFCEIFEKVREKIGKDTNLSHFEWLTLMAEYYFFEIRQADYAIFEVGMGGIFDATNVIPHKFCIITRLALDHCDVLGNDLEEISLNKFGIITSGALVFHTKFPNSRIEKIASEYSEKYGAKLIDACDFSMAVDVDSNNTCDYPKFSVQTSFGKFRMNLAGERAAENTALALTFFDYFLRNIETKNEERETRSSDRIKERSLEKYARVISQIEWFGRMQLVRYRDCDIFLSGDHNPNGIQSLLNLLQYYRFRKIHFVVGIGATKDHHNMLEMLFSVPNSRIYLTETTVHTLPVDHYNSEDLKKATYVSASQKDALDAAIDQVLADRQSQKEIHSFEEDQTSENEMVVVTGSLYLVGKILEIVQETIH